MSVSGTLKAVAKGATFTFTGAVTGALHITPVNATCTANAVAASAGAIFVRLGKLKGAGAAVSWVVHITVLGTGAVKIGPNALPHVTLQDSTATGLGALRASTAGMLVAHVGKGRFTGTVHASLTSTNGRPVHISGTWDCSAA